MKLSLATLRIRPRLGLPRWARANLKPHFRRPRHRVSLGRAKTIVYKLNPQGSPAGDGE